MKSKHFNIDLSNLNPYDPLLAINVTNGGKTIINSLINQMKENGLNMGLENTDPVKQHYYH
jgi:hypothetical protein